MRNVIIAVVFGLAVGLAAWLWAGSRVDSAHSALVPNATATSGTTARSVIAADPLFETPLRPGLQVVVTQRGQPVSAQLELFQDRFELGRSSRRWIPMAQAKTDLNGVAAFPAAAGHYLVRVESNGLLGAKEFDVSVAHASTRVTIELGATRPISGFVHRDGTNDPIPRARIQIHFGKRPSTPIASAVSDSFGRFSLEVPDAPQYAFEVSAVGFIPLTDTDLATEALDFALVRGVEVHGLVVDANQTALQGVTVTCMPGELTVTTNTAGEFSAVVAPAGASFHALALDGRQALVRIAAPSSNQRITLTLADGFSLSGVVRGGELTRQPIDVRVLAEPDDLEVAALSTTSGERFEAKGLPAGRYLIRAQQGSGRRATAVGLELPSSAPVELTLSGAGALTGLVRDDSNAPIAGATVTLEWTSGMNEIGRSVLTDESGRFLFDELLPAEVTVQATLGELVSGESRTYVAPETTGELNLSLAAQGRLAGFLDAAAKTVLVSGPASRQRVPVVGGRFEVMLAPGDYRLFVLEGEIFSDAAEAHVRAGETTTLTLETWAPDAGHRLKMHPELGSGLSFENSPGGVRVDFLMPDCPAARAGVLIGDLVVSIDASPTRDATDAFARVRRPAGEELALVVRRDGKDLTLTLR